MIIPIDITNSQCILIMKRSFSTSLILLFFVWTASNAQVTFSAIAGGGISDLHTGFPFSDNSYLHAYLKPGPLAQVGISTSSLFRKEGMLSWEVQILIKNSTLKNLPLDSIQHIYTTIETPNGNEIEAITDIIYHRDYDNIYRWNYWSFNVPFSLNFQVFGPVGWKIGGNINYLLSKFPEEDKIKINGGNPNLNTKFDSFSWQGHTGFFGIINPRIRIDALVFSDFKPRLTHGGQILDDGTPVDPEYRAMGLFVNAIYRLN